MKSLVIFGAGNIGRGFIAPLFCGGDKHADNTTYHITFIDLDQQRIDAINQDKHYTVSEVFNDQTQCVHVSQISGIDARAEKSVTTAIASADLLACAVGLHALPHIAPAIVKGLQARWQEHSAPALDILVCENGITAAEILYDAVHASAHATQATHVLAHISRLFGCVRTSIGRMIPPNTDNSSLDISVEPYAYLPCEAAAFRGPMPSITGLAAVHNFTLTVHLKLYLHNGTHACLAYLGAQKGLTHIPACAADPDIAQCVHAAGMEIIAALLAEHGSAHRDTCTQLLDDLLHRYSNTALADTVHRVCQDPIRKLAAGDRLLGAATLCAQHAIPAPQLHRCIAVACHYRMDTDDPRATEWNTWQQHGITHVLEHASGLTSDDPTVHSIHQTWKDDSIL